MSTGQCSWCQIREGLLNLLQGASLSICDCQKAPQQKPFPAENGRTSLESPPATVKIAFSNLLDLFFFHNEWARNPSTGRRTTHSKTPNTCEHTITGAPSLVEGGSTQLQGSSRDVTFLASTCLLRRGSDRDRLLQVNEKDSPQLRRQLSVSGETTGFSAPPTPPPRSVQATRFLDLGV